MKITTKLVGLLSAFVAFGTDAGMIKAPNLTLDELHNMEKGVFSKMQESAKKGKPDDIVKAIKAQLAEKSVGLKLSTDDEKALGNIVNSGVQDHQDRLTATALTGDISYSFKDTTGEYKIKRRDITDLLGQMAKLRLTGEDMQTVLTATGGDTVEDCAKGLNDAWNNINKSQRDLMLKIVKLIQCLASASGYQDMFTLTKPSVKKEEFLAAAHTILKNAVANIGDLAEGSSLKVLADIAKAAVGTGDEAAIKLLTPSVLQAFTTLIFLQRSDTSAKGEVKNLSEYLVTRGNVKKVMKDTGYKLLLTDDMSLEASGLLALGKDAVDVMKGVTAGVYSVPAAVLLGEDGKPVVGTPVIPAPYLEYAINHNELLPANNIIVDNTDGVASVLTTYGTVLSLTGAAEVQSAKLDDPQTATAGGLSKIVGKIVPSHHLANLDKINNSGTTDPAGKGTDSETPDQLAVYGAPEPLDKVGFKFTKKAATVIMSSLLANTVPVGVSTSQTTPEANIHVGPYYAARIYEANCPVANAVVKGKTLLNSTAAVMLMSGKDPLRDKQEGDDIVTIPSTAPNIAKRIQAISKYVIPGFDLDNNGDYVVNGLKMTKLEDLGGTSGKLTSEVLQGKGRELLSAISSISKSVK